MNRLFSRLTKVIPKKISPEAVYWRLLSWCGNRRARFEAMHLSSADPWEFKTGPYTEKRYQEILGDLPKDHYSRALEVGCSVGVFTALLSKRAENIRAIDISNEALKSAQQTCGSLKNILFERSDILGFRSPEKYDLIVCAEVLYYTGWNLEAHRMNIAKILANHLNPEGHLVVSTLDSHAFEDYEGYLIENGFCLMKTRICKRPRRSYRISVFTPKP